MARLARGALAASAIDERSYVDLVTTELAKTAQIILLRQVLLEQQVALETLIGAGMPVVTLSPEVVRS